MRCLVGSVEHDFVDVLKLSPDEQASILDPENYRASQAFGSSLRDQDYDGLHYPSVRKTGAFCIAAFYPDCVAIPVQAGHVKFEFDGKRVARYLDDETKRWVTL